LEGRGGGASRDARQMGHEPPHPGTGLVDGPRGWGIAPGSAEGLPTPDPGPAPDESGWGDARRAAEGRRTPRAGAGLDRDRWAGPLAEPAGGAAHGGAMDPFGPALLPPTSPAPSPLPRGAQPVERYVVAPSAARRQSDPWPLVDDDRWPELPAAPLRARGELDGDRDAGHLLQLEREHLQRLDREQRGVPWSEWPS
jgi:hypothetical protein